jgi:hypothetical protein
MKRGARIASWMELRSGHLGPWDFLLSQAWEAWCALGKRDKHEPWAPCEMKREALVGWRLLVRRREVEAHTFTAILICFREEFGV